MPFLRAKRQQQCWIQPKPTHLSRRCCFLILAVCRNPCYLQHSHPQTVSSTMANQVPRLWEGVLSGLHSMATPGSDHSRKTERVTELLDKIASSPEQPKAAWKRLLKDMQVRGPSTQPRQASTCSACGTTACTVQW
jgi:hypothetical protein